MKYVPPVGGAVNDPYVDANPGSGIEGSPVPAAAIEHPMREILAVISAAGIAPSEANLAQLLAALRSAGVFQTQATNDATTKAATTAFCNPGASLATNGYQKLPSGLIIQWGIANLGYGGTLSSVGTAITQNFPLSFPVAGLALSILHNGAYPQGFAGNIINNGQFSTTSTNAATLTGFFIAIGH